MILSIYVTSAEIRSGTLSPDHLEEAVAALRRDGAVVLNDVIDPDHVAALLERMLADLPRILARSDAPYNFNRGNVQQDAPPFPPFLFGDVLLNEQVIAVTHRLLGDGVTNGYYSGNTALPGGAEQPAHPDLGQLWPDLDAATPAFAFVINVPVVDMTPENGSTRLWLGTHLDTTMHVGLGTLRVPEAALEARRAHVPPVQPTVRAGSVVIRDVRLWHQGMPNHTDAPRPMIAMIHSIHWWEAETVRFLKGSESFFEHPVLRTRACFVDGPIDYLHHNEAYDFVPASP